MYWKWVYFIADTTGFVGANWSTSRISLLLNKFLHRARVCREKTSHVASGKVLAKFRIHSKAATYTENLHIIKTLTATLKSHTEVSYKQENSKLLACYIV